MLHFFDPVRGTDLLSVVIKIVFAVILGGIIGLAFCVVMIIGMVKIFQKAGKPGWTLHFYAKQGGNQYPTHGLGPVAKYMDINRGDSFDFLVSIESKQASYRHYAQELFDDWRRDFGVKIGDMSQTLIRTKLGRSILLQLDACTPRPYSRINLVSGTRGVTSRGTMLREFLTSL